MIFQLDFQEGEIVTHEYQEKQPFQSVIRNDPGLNLVHTNHAQPHAKHQIDLMKNLKG